MSESNTEEEIINTDDELLVSWGRPGSCERKSAYFWVVKIFYRAMFHAVSNGKFEKIDRQKFSKNLNRLDVINISGTFSNSPQLIRCFDSIRIKQMQK